MTYGQYLYTGAYPATSGNVDIGGPRQVDLTSQSSPVTDALKRGTVQVVVNLTTADRRIKNSVTVTIFDKDGRSASVSKTLSFSSSPQNQSFVVPVQMDGEFDIEHITHFVICNDTAYNKNIYITKNQCAVHAYWVMPTQVTNPSSIYCVPNSVASGSSTLMWQGEQAGDFNPVTEYIIYRATTADGSYTRLSKAADGKVTRSGYPVESRSGNGNAYYYKVKTIGTRKNFDADISDNYATLTTEWTAPAAPTGLSLTAYNTDPGQTAILYWTASVPGTNNAVARYEVWRKAGSADDIEYELLTVTSGTAVSVDGPVENGTPYYFKVKAIGTVTDTQWSDSDFSAPTDAMTTEFTAPTAPTGLQVDGVASVVLDPGESATLTWSASQDGDLNPVQGYRIYVNGEQLSYTTETSAVVRASLTASTTNVYTIRAVGRWSMSQPSSSVRITTTTPPQPPRSNEEITDFMFFSGYTLQYIRDDAISMVCTEEEYRLNGSFPYDAGRPITCGTRIGWLEGSELRIYEVRQPRTNPVTMVQEFEAEHVAISELSDMVIEACSYTNIGVQSLVQDLITGTGWSVGTVNLPDGISAMDVTFDYSSVWDALGAVSSTYGVEIVPRMAYTYDGIERYIDILSRRGEYRGVRLSLDLNVQQAGITYDDTEQYTALYGLGKASTVTAADGTQHEERLTFGPVIWSTDDGKPANKPQGQKWIEDTAATTLYGRGGEKRVGIVEFSDVTSQYALLQATWDTLQTVKAPKVTIEMTAFDLGTLGYAEQGIALGDDVVIIIDQIGVELMARVTKYQRDILRPERGKPTIGDARQDILGKIYSASQKQITAGGAYTLDVDRTLSVDGMAADAKTVGDKLDELETAVDGKQDALSQGAGITLTDNVVACTITQYDGLDLLWSGSAVISGTTFTLSQPAAKYRHLVFVLAAQYQPFMTNKGCGSFVAVCASSARIYHVGGTLTWGESSSGDTVKPAITVRYYNSGYNAGGASSANPSVIAIYGVI